MVEQKTIMWSAFVLMMGIIASTVDPSIFESTDYYGCESRPHLGFLTCDGFSKYVSYVGKCLNATTPEGIVLGNKICREGWVLIENDEPPGGEIIKVYVDDYGDVILL